MRPSCISAATDLDPDHAQCAITVLEAQCAGVCSDAALIRMSAEQAELWQRIDSVCYLLSP